MDTLQPLALRSSNGLSSAVGESLGSPENAASKPTPKTLTEIFQTSVTKQAEGESESLGVLDPTESDDCASLGNTASVTTGSGVKVFRRQRQFITKFVESAGCFIQIPHFRVTDNWDNIAESWIREMIRVNPHLHDKWTVDLVVHTGHWYLHGSTTLNHRQRTYAMNGLVTRRENGCIARIIDENTGRGRDRSNSPPPVARTAQLSRDSVTDSDTCPRIWTSPECQQDEVFETAVESSESIHYDSAVLGSAAQPDISKGVMSPYPNDESTIEFHEKPESVTSATNRTDDCLSTPSNPTPELYRTYIPPQNPAKVTHIPVSCSWCGQWNDHYVSTCPDYLWDHAHQNGWTMASHDQYVDTNSANAPLSNHVPLSNIGKLHPGSFEYFHKFGFPTPDDRSSLHGALGLAFDRLSIVNTPGQPSLGSSDAPSNVDAGVPDIHPADGSTLAPMPSAPKLNPYAPCFIFRPKTPVSESVDFTPKHIPPKPRWADVVREAHSATPTTLKSTNEKRLVIQQTASKQNEEPPKTCQSPPKKLWSSIFHADELSKAKNCPMQKPNLIPGTEPPAATHPASPAAPLPKRDTTSTRTMRVVPCRPSTSIATRQTHDIGDHILCDSASKDTKDGHDWTVVEPQSEKDKSRNKKSKSKKPGRNKDYLKASWRP